METQNDTFKVQLVSDEYKIVQKSDKILVIEQKEKAHKQKEIYETTLFTSFFFPLTITLITFSLARLYYRKREKIERKKIRADIVKLEGEKVKIDQEIIQIKRTFQPYVLATLQKTQETILNDKINALREIAKFRTNFFTYSEINISDENIDENSNDNIEEYYEYMLNIYNYKLFENFEKIVLLNGYLFPNDIINRLNSILNDIGHLVSIIDTNFNNKKEIINDQILLKSLSSKFDEVIEDIRKDLHLDDSFIHDFIENNKVL